MTESVRLCRASVGTPQYTELVARLERRGDADLGRVESSVREILAAVRSEGDPALHRFIQRFEGRTSPNPWLVDYDGEKSLASLPADLQAALRTAAERIRSYHQRQKEQLTTFEYETDGVRLGSRVTPLERVGVYAPGGKARYPSSVLMSAIPAQVAGVGQIVLASPDPGPEVRAACHLAGVHALLDAGGAQAIAAMAYGTQTVSRVDKIVGPGNIYVAAAKRMVFGEVSIDGIAGPSEILVIGDDTADARIVAADLLSQAEHDEDAYALLICTNSALADQVENELPKQLATLPRQAIAQASLEKNGCILVTPEMDEVIRLANRLAVEHVALHLADARQAADRIVRAGALFVGSATPEAAGDYLAGPSHVLPTGGAARFSAPLGVYDFVSRSSLIEYQLSALESQSSHITNLARAEGLEAHARAVEFRSSK